MPLNNAFRHQNYGAGRPVGTYRLRQFESADAVSISPTRLGAALRRAGIQQVMLVHGTFTGNDVAGLVRVCERFVPQSGPRLRELGQQWTDRLAHDVGNYSDNYLGEFRRLLDDDRETLVQRWGWSGENHHLGRAEAAVRLVDHLCAAAREGRHRSLLWGHSHAGNVFALVTNMLAGSPEAVQRFFSACHPLFFTSRVSAVDRERWQRVRDVLRDRALVASLQLDIATFGTPARYGWETLGYRQLLHIVHHRPASGLPDYQAPFPVTWDDLWTARHGDYIQQLGIAGTDFLPLLSGWRSLLVERNLDGLLEHDLRRRDTVTRLQWGKRVADDGLTLLVDYPTAAEAIRRQLLGHAIYTSPEWLPNHLGLVVTELGWLQSAESQHA